MLKEHETQRDHILTRDLNQLAIQTALDKTSKGSKSQSALKKRATTAKSTKAYQPKGDPSNALHITQPHAPKYAEDDTHSVAAAMAFSHL